jgi:hypothetical protein
MRPPWQRSEKCQNQNHDQYGSKHFVVPFPAIWGRARATVARADYS